VLFANLKNVSPELMLNKVTKDENIFCCSFLFGQPGQKLSRIYEADDYSVSANNTKPNVSGIVPFTVTPK
jgi:hypothetical protein